MNLFLLALAAIGNLGWIISLFRRDEVARKISELESHIAILEWEARMRGQYVDELQVRCGRLHAELRKRSCVYEGPAEAAADWPLFTVN